MGMIHLFDRPKNTIYVVWDGEINAETCINQARKLLAEPDWPAISRLIVDTQMASTTVTMEDMQIVAALFGEHPENVMKKKVAILAGSLFSRARTFGTLVEPFGISMLVFNHLDTACTFLGLDHTETEHMLERLRLTCRGGADPGPDLLST